jgi:outer membrane protein TolC
MVMSPLSRCRQLVPVLMVLCSLSLTAADAPPLTLDQALAEAAVHATGPAVAQARLERVRTLQLQARALLLPTVNLNGGLTSAWHSRPPYQGRSDETVAGEAAVELKLFDGTAFPALDSAKVQIAAQEHASRDLRRATAFGVASSYLTVLTAERLRGVADRRLAVAQQLLDEAKARLKAGLAIASDVTRAEVEVADGQLSVTQAKRGIAIGRLALQEAIGGLEPGTLSDPKVEAPDDQPIDQLLAKARDQRDDLASAKLTADGNRFQVDVIKRQNWPVLSVRAGVNDQDTTAPAVVATDPEWFAGINAKWTIWDGGLRDGRVEEQLATGRELRASERAALLAAERQVRGALVEIQTALTAVSQAETRSRSAAADAADSLARYRAGTGTATELADAQLRSAQADADLEQRRIDVLVYRLTLRQALGGWPLTDREP